MFVTRKVRPLVPQRVNGISLTRHPVDMNISQILPPEGCSALPQSLRRVLEATARAL
jgi:hypothetical protein